jgi:RimJ/RimL family protein N-acetyltransferase
MIKLATEQLIITPLTYRQMEMWNTSSLQFEGELGYQLAQKDMGSVFLKELKDKILKIKNDRINYFWITYWIIVLKEEKKIIGTIGFDGSPEEDGILNLDFQIYTGYEGKGFLSETLNRFLAWAFKQDLVEKIHTITSSSDDIAIEALEEFDFVCIDQETRDWTWELNKP